MSSSSGKKIVRKVFYTTGTAIAKVDKFTEGLVDIAKSFKAGYHLLNHEPSPSSNGNGKFSKPLGQQLDGLYGYLGRIIHDNIEGKTLSYQFKPEHEHLQKQAEELLNKISPIENLPKQEVLTKKTDIDERPAQEPVDISSSQDDITRLKSVVSLSRMNTPQSRLELLSHAKDRDSLIRRVIVNCINPEGGQEEEFAIVKFINDPDEDVARIAIRKSAKIRNRLGFSYLISRLDSENVKIRNEAIDALRIITGSDLGFNPTAAESGRSEAIKRWQQVWQDNQMNPQFLIDEEATRSIIKKKYFAKTVSKELEEGQKAEPVVKKTKTKA